MTHLGKLLRLHRAVEGLSTRELAEQIGITVSTLNRFERTDTGMSVDHYFKISHWLLSRTETETNAPQG